MSGFLKRPRLLGLLAASTALLLVSCGDDETPTSVPTPVKVVITATPGPTATPIVITVAGTPIVVTATPEPTATPELGGQVVERAGLSLFLPKNYIAGGPVIPADPRDPQSGGIFTVAFPGDPPNLDSTKSTSQVTQLTTSSIYERLIMWPTEPGYNLLENRLEPGLAESWDVSGDGLTFTLKLREGVKWHNLPPVNGREFTADDVKFTFDYFTQEGSVQASSFGTVGSLEVVDSHSVRYQLTKRNPGFLFQISNTGTGFIVPKEVVDADGDLSQTVIGTGPFMQDGAYRLKEGMDFLANPDYWEKDAKGNQYPYLDGWQFRVIEDAAARLAAFRTGKTNWDGNLIGSPSQASDVLKTNPDTLFQEYTPAWSGNGYLFRLDKPPFEDVRVRRALSLAVDYESWSQVVYGTPVELAVLIRGFNLGEDDTLASLGEYYQYDPARARELLAEAGYDEDALSFKLEYFPYNQQFISNAELLAAFWRLIGVETNLVNPEYTVFRGNVDIGGWDEMGYSFAFPSPLDIDSSVDFAHPEGAGNPTQGFINDSQLTTWVEEFHAAFGDDAKRLDSLQKIRQRIVDQVYIIPRPLGHEFQAVSPWVRNYQPINNVIVGDKDMRPLMHAWIDSAYR